jgi:hypothetical protein
MLKNNIPMENITVFDTTVYLISLTPGINVVKQKRVN